MKNYLFLAFVLFCNWNILIGNTITTNINQDSFYYDIDELKEIGSLPSYNHIELNADGLNKTLLKCLNSKKTMPIEYLKILSTQTEFYGKYDGFVWGNVFEFEVFINESGELDKIRKRINSHGAISVHRLKRNLSELDVKAGMVNGNRVKSKFVLQLVVSKLNVFKYQAGYDLYKSLREIARQKRKSIKYKYWEKYNLSFEDNDVNLFNLISNEDLARLSKSLRVLHDMEEKAIGRAMNKFRKEIMQRESIDRSQIILKVGEISRNYKQEIGNRM